MTDDQILEDFIGCSSCTDIGKMKKKYDKGLTDRQKIDKMMAVLPGIMYIRSQMLNYIFSNGLTTGSINSDVELDDFLFRKNDFDATNYSVLREAIGWAAVDGECGIRRYEDNLYLVRSGKYAVVTLKEDGIDKIIGYVVARDDDISVIYDLNEEDFIKYYQNGDFIFLNKDEFCHIRNNTSTLHGSSPLLSDKLRMDLLITSYQRLNYDVEYDGPGRIIIRPKDGYISGENNDVSTTMVVNASGAGATVRAEQAKQEAKRMARDIKESSSDSVIVMSNGFDSHIEHLERVTKATEFFDWLSQEGVILAQAMGMAPSLLELGKISGNVSMEKIIDNSMLNNIVPLRELYAIQFSKFICNIIGVPESGKVYFDKYDLQQSEDENETRAKIVDMMVKLYGIEQYGLVDSLSQMLFGNLYDENNDLRKMSVGKKTTPLKDIISLEEKL